MPYKDPNKQREYNREYQRKRRSMKDGYTHGTKQTSIDFTLSTADDLKAVLENVISDLLRADIDVGVKGRVAAQLLQVGCRLLETSDIERRLEALEARLSK
jgi:hypothetical protein